MAGPSTNTTQRLLRELKDYAKSPNEALLHLGPVNDEDILRWEAVLKGVNGTPYEGMRCGNQVTQLSHPNQPTSTGPLTHISQFSPGGLWHLRIAIPSNYPLAPPTIHFTTRISHPNISFATGEICLTLLTTEHWSPVYTLSSTLTAIHQLLTDPQPDSPLNVDVAALLREGDIPAWESVVRYWTGEERWQGSAPVGR
ncbi:Ubiquitin-conjugating enzyme E2 pex4 [Penicillium rolfsii]|nr:Ubiquitin-conjugating enzyme E2 pex4 [Penicillium rolfsii]